MAGVYKFETTETEADREQRLRTQKTASDKERIQLLYLLKTGKRLRFSPASPCSRPDAGCPQSGSVLAEVRQSDPSAIASCKLPAQHHE
jgi:hypothetical protein